MYASTKVSQSSSSSLVIEMALRTGEMTMLTRPSLSSSEVSPSSPVTFGMMLVSTMLTMVSRSQLSKPCASYSDSS